MSPDFMDDLNPEERAQVEKFLALLDDYRDMHTEDEYDHLVDLFRLADLFKNEPALAAGDSDFLPASKVKPDNPLNAEATTCNGRTHVTAVGTQDELINAKLAADYMFAQLGKKKSRCGPTEYGDWFCLQVLSRDQYRLLLRINPRAEKPYGMGSVDIYETDISALLKQIPGCAS